jgi:hypothetical protein
LRPFSVNGWKSRSEYYTLDRFMAVAQRETAMAKTASHIRAWRAGLFVAVLLVAAGGFAGCATTGTGEAQVKTVWQLSDQYVKIEKQDHPAGGTVSANIHPADISADRLRGMLESVEVRPTGEEKALQLFNDNELKILSENIHAGLASAGPDEDVTFAVIGHYPVLMGVLKERMVTTGRVFHQDGHLNIIFGDVHRGFRENEDRRLHPLLLGSRVRTGPREWALTAKPGGESFTAKRPDWITFSLTSPGPVVTPAMREDAGGTGQGGKAVTPAVPPKKPAIPGKKSVEERLLILNELLSKKLITEEEYRAKRLEILNEL